VLSGLPTRDLSIDLYQIFMRARVLELNGRETVFRYPVRKEAFFMGQKIYEFRTEEIKLKGVSLNFETQNLFKRLEKLTIVDSRQPWTMSCDLFLKIEMLATDDPEVAMYACKTSKHLQRVHIKNNNVKI
jgi:hypothetical protein